MFTEIVLGGTSTDFYFHLPRVFVHIPSVLPALCVGVFWAFATIYFPKSTAGLIEIKKKKEKKTALQVKSKLFKINRDKIFSELFTTVLIRTKTVKAKTIV